MTELVLARLQFAATSVYHFIFVPLTLGLSLFLAIVQTVYVRTGDEKYKKMLKFWGKLFLLNFAVGVVTGIVQEFQFGMAWSEYSRFVGDIFGAPLAIEALMAFFIESTFLGIWIFGWDKLSKGMHLASIWLVAIAANLSSFWILVASAWMQHPVGYEIVGARAQMTDFFALLTNSTVWTLFPHVIAAGMVTGAFFVMGISAYHLLRKSDEQPVFETSFRLGAIYAAIAGVAVIVIGHAQMQHLVETQPMKVAAAEALWESEDPAAMSLFTVGDEGDLRDVVSIRVPGVLSLLAYNRFTGEVTGIKEIQAQFVEEHGPGDYVPPVAVSYWNFRAMVGIGMVMMLLSLYGLHTILRGSFTKPNQRWYLRLMIPAILLPYIANTTGWILAEMGRQPWLVYGLQLTTDGLSPNLTMTDLTISLIVFVLIYGLLLAVDIYLLWKYASRGIGGDTPSGREFFGEIFPPLSGRADEATSGSPAK